MLFFVLFFNLFLWKEYLCQERPPTPAPEPDIQDIGSPEDFGEDSFRGERRVLVSTWEEDQDRGKKERCAPCEYQSLDTYLRKGGRYGRYYAPYVCSKYYCLNGGKCFCKKRNYKFVQVCKCRRGFSGKRCEIDRRNNCAKLLFIYCKMSGGGRGCSCLLVTTRRECYGLSYCRVQPNFCAPSIDRTVTGRPTPTIAFK